MADTLGYNDLLDLIQNQRALAELVAKVKTDYQTVINDVAFARDLDSRIQNLNTSMQTVLDNFDRRIAESDTNMKNALTQVTNNANALKQQAQDMVNTLTVNGTQSFSLLEAEMRQILDIVKGTGDLIDAQGNKKDGMIDILHRVETLEARDPSIKIAAEGTEIPLVDRLDGILYGKVTDEVRDIEKGQAIYISPSLQGVVQ